MTKGINLLIFIILEKIRKNSKDYRVYFSKIWRFFYNRYGLHWAGSLLAPSSASFFSNRWQNAEHIGSLHRQTKPFLQRKDLLTLFRCLRDTSTETAGVDSLYTLVVSTPTGSNLKWVPSAPYVQRFRSSASRAACSTDTAELWMLVSAYVSA